MVDTKIVNTLEGNTATTKCFICGAGRGNLSAIGGTVNKSEFHNEDKLKYSISPLYARIKTFEFFLDLGYHMALSEHCRQKYSQTSTEEKKIFAQRKKNVQDIFRREMGLLGDMPKAGFRNTNDGNSFFNHILVLNLKCS